MPVKAKSAALREYLLIMLPIIALFVAAGYLVITSAQDFYNEQAADETRRIANSYAQSLAAAAEAANIIDDLLEDKLMTTAQIVARYDGQYSNQLLAEIASIMQVDEIYVYNGVGEIVYSNTGLYLGWRAEEGHPVHSFMYSGKKSHVDEIRKDSESERYLKYAYWRLDDTSRFLQLGVLAERIHEFLGRFEVEHLLAEITSDPFIKCAVFYDNNFEPIAFHGHEGEFIISSEAKAALQANREFASEIYSAGEPYYQVMLPIWADGSRLGTLSINHRLADTKLLLSRVRLIGITTLVVIFGLLMGVLSANRKKNETLIRYSYYDAVTGLPNKTYFEELFVRSPNGNGNGKKACLLVDCNLDLLSMAVGYQYSEMILKECAASLLQVEDPVQHVFHLGAARFLLYVEDYNERQDLVALGQQVIDRLRQPLQAKRKGVAVGIVEIDHKELDANTIIRRATIAASSTRESDNEGYAFFDNSMEEKLLRENIIERELGAAVDSNSIAESIYLVYQPIVELRQNRIVGLEALTRMRSAQLGNVSPAEFVPIAEQTGLIIPLGQHILRLACGFLAELRKLGYEDLKMSINISLVQLLQDSFVSDVFAITQAVGVEPGHLTLEITESLLMDEYGAINDKLADLADLGIQIAIDDFGTGYSSLSRTQGLRIHGIKIDKSFIDSLLLIEPEQAITRDIITMAHRQGLFVVAEGVEDLSQREYLCSNNCDFMQGYLFSKPLAPEGVIRLLEQDKRC